MDPCIAPRVTVKYKGVALTQTQNVGNMERYLLEDNGGRNEETAMTRLDGPAKREIKIWLDARGAWVAEAGGREARLAKYELYLWRRGLLVPLWWWKRVILYTLCKL